jgi:hypothetical protein
MEAQHGVRYRVNVATSTKGYHTYDATVEFLADPHGIGLEADDVMEKPNSGMSFHVSRPNRLRAIREALIAESYALVASLEARYPNGERVVLPVEIETTEPFSEIIKPPTPEEGADEVVPPPDPQATNFEHSKIAHPPELCFCYGSAVADLGPICSECGCCECGCCGDLGNPQHGTKCSSYPHEAKVE